MEKLNKIAKFKGIKYWKIAKKLGNMNKNVANLHKMY